MTARRPLLLRGVIGVLRHLILPRCLSVLFMLVAIAASSMLGGVIMLVVQPLLAVFDAGSPMGDTLAGICLGWLALWLLFLYFLAYVRPATARNANHTTDASHPLDLHSGVDP